MLLCVAACAAACSAPKAGVEARYNQFELDGKFGADVAGVSANNTLDELGMSGTDETPSVAANFKWGLPHLSFLLLEQVEYAGTGTVGSDITLGGVTLPAGATVDSKTKVGLNSAYLTFDLIPGRWELGLGLGVVSVDYQLSSENTANGDEISIDETVPVPVLAARAGVGFWRADVSALVGYTSYSVDGNSMELADVDLTGRIRLLGDGDRASGWITGGYRFVGFDTEFDDGSDRVAADVQLQGPYLGLRFQF
jgi:hypothetical protein